MNYICKNIPNLKVHKSCVIFLSYVPVGILQFMQKKRLAWYAMHVVRMLRKHFSVVCNLKMHLKEPKKFKDLVIYQNTKKGEEKKQSGICRLAFHDHLCLEENDL